MSIGLEDFLRLLPQVIGRALSVEREQCAFFDPEKKISLQWNSLPPVAYGSLSLPQLEVRMTFSGEAEQAEAFLRRFDSIYQRGGG